MAGSACLPLRMKTPGNRAGAAVLGSGRVPVSGGTGSPCFLPSSPPDHRPHHAVRVFCYFHLTAECRGARSFAGDWPSSAGRNGAALASGLCRASSSSQKELKTEQAHSSRCMASTFRGTGRRPLLGPLPAV